MTEMFCGNLRLVPVIASCVYSSVVTLPWPQVAPGCNIHDSVDIQCMYLIEKVTSPRSGYVSVCITVR